MNTISNYRLLYNLVNRNGNSEIKTLIDHLKIKHNESPLIVVSILSSKQ